MTQTKAMENRIKAVEKQVQSELEKRLAALEKKILEPICPTVPDTPTKATIPTNSSVDPITGLKWSAILGGCVKPKDENGWILLQQRDATAKNVFLTKKLERIQKWISRDRRTGGKGVLARSSGDARKNVNGKVGSCHCLPLRGRRNQVCR